MNRGAILALGAVALALLAYIVVFERDSLSSGELAARKGRALETFVRERVSAFEVQRKGRTVRLERAPAEDEGFEPWQVVKPWQEDADTDAVDALLGELEWLDARRRLDDVSDEDLKKFGLDKPRLRLRFEAGRTRTLLELGHQDVHGEGVYARVDGSRSVLVVPKTLEEALNQDIGQFRTKQFLGTLTMAWTRSIDLHTGDKDWPLRVDDEARWWFEAEPRSFADPQAVQQWLRQFDDLRATRYVDPDHEAKVRASLQGDGVRSALVKIIPDAGREDKKPRIIDLRVGAECEGHPDEVYVTIGDKGVLACVHQDAVSALFDDPEKLRLRRLFAFDVSEIESFSFKTGKHLLALERDGEGWKRSEGTGEPPPRMAVEYWLADLAKQRGQHVEARRPGPTLSSLTLTLASGDTWTVELGAANLEGHVVRRGDEPAQLSFDRTTADLLSLWPERFREHALWDVQPSRVRAVHVQGQGATRELERVELGWRERGQEELATDAERVREIVRDLTKLEVVRWRASEAVAEHGLSKPMLTLRMELDASDKPPAGPLLLRIGAATHDGAHYAEVDGGPIGELPVESVALLRELLQPLSPEEAAAAAAAAQAEQAPMPDGVDDHHGHHAH